MSFAVKVEQWYECIEWNGQYVCWPDQFGRVRFFRSNCDDARLPEWINFALFNRAVSQARMACPGVKGRYGLRYSRERRQYAQALCEALNADPSIARIV